MRIADDRLDDLIARWEAAFGERLSREQAYPIATKLLFFCRQIRRPLPASAQEYFEVAPEHEPEAS